MMDFLRRILNTRVPSGRITLGDFLRAVGVAAGIAAIQAAFGYGTDLLGNSVAVTLLLGVAHRWVAGRLPAIDDASGQADAPTLGTAGPPLAAAEPEPHIPPITYPIARPVPGPGEYERHNNK